MDYYDYQSIMFAKLEDIKKYIDGLLIIKKVYDDYQSTMLA
jgi:hypothetical protein